MRSARGVAPANAGAACAVACASPSRRNLRRALLGTASTAVLAVMLATPMPARASEWTGTASSDWFDAANWTGGVPTSSDATDISTGPTAVIAAPGAQSQYGFIASIPFSTGALTVTGTGSTWTSSRELYVGHSGNGTLTIENDGTVSNRYGYIGYNADSTGTVTVDGATSAWTNSGLLMVGALGNGTLTIQNGGAVSNDEGYIGFGSSSTGTATVNGTYSTWTNSGFLYVGPNGNGTLNIQNGGTVSAAGVVIASSATGTLNIGAASGQTAVAPGTLTTPTVAFGAGTGSIVFNHTATNYAFDPAISGPGSVKAEAGTTTLTANNSYTGATTVSGGTLLVTGAIYQSSGLTVDAGATVGGTGFLPTATINGTLAPGVNGIGTVTVRGGNLTFGAGSTYAVDISPSAADRTDVVANSAALAGTVRARFEPGAYVTKQYTILHADNGLGGSMFGGLTTLNMPAGLTAALSYGSNDVFLNLTAQLGLDAAGLGGNQSNVANSINGYFNNGGALPAGFLPLFGLSGAPLSTALSQLSGEATTGAQQAGMTLTGQFLSMMLDPFAAGRGGAFGGNGGTLGFASESTLPPDIALAYARMTKAAPAPTMDAPRWSLWGGAFGGTSTTDGNAAAGAHDLSARTGGFAAGADYRVAPGTTMGFALAGGATNWSLGGGLGSGRGDAFQAGVYAMTQPGPWYLSGALSFAQHWMTTERTAFAGDRLEGRFNAQSYGGRIEGGWRIATALGAVTPYAAAQVQRFHLPGFTETDLSGGGFALAYASRNTDTTRSELGARFERLVAVSDSALLALQARAAWAHDWTHGAALTPVFQALPGASFVVAGATAAPDLALLSAGAELRLASGWSIAGRFNGEFADGLRTYAGTGTLRYAW
jgi:T5SS/PEP-CTERM-associated repeat protein/autotransporter-associated beta strand protein